MKKFMCFLSVCVVALSLFVPISGVANGEDVVGKVALVLRTSHPVVAQQLFEISQSGLKVPEGSHGNQEQLEILVKAASIVKSVDAELAEELEDVIADLELGM